MSVYLSVCLPVFSIRLVLAHLADVFVGTGTASVQYCERACDMSFTYVVPCR